MNPPSCLRESREGILLSVKVTPRASRNEIGGLQGDELKIKVTAPPVGLDRLIVSVSSGSNVLSFATGMKIV